MIDWIIRIGVPLILLVLLFRLLITWQQVKAEETKSAGDSTDGPDDGKAPNRHD